MTRPMATQQHPREIPRAPAVRASRTARTGAAADVPPERIQAAFFRAAFAVMGHIAKADGRVSETEIRAAYGRIKARRGFK